MRACEFSGFLLTLSPVNLTHLLPFFNPSTSHSIWLSTLSAFLDILYPVSALAIFGEDPTLRLGTEWVRGNLNRCSLSASDTAPVTPVSVSGWKLAVPWSRSPFSQQRGPKTQSGGPSASFVRFLDANPKHRDKKRIKDTVGEGQEKVHVNTMWWKEADRYSESPPSIRFNSNQVLFEESFVFSYLRPLRLTYVCLSFSFSSKSSTLIMPWNRTFPFLKHRVMYYVLWRALGWS